MGTAGVEVKTGVGDRVEVGESVGSRVKIGVGESWPVIGITAWAVCVPATTTVCAIMVPMTFASGVETVTDGVAQAREATNRAITAKRMGLDFNILPLFRDRRDYNTENDSASHFVDVHGPHLFHEFSSEESIPAIKNSNPFRAERGQKTRQIIPGLYFVTGRLCVIQVPFRFCSVQAMMIA